MTESLLKYIRKHKYIYNYLRDDSAHYKYLYQDNRYIEELKKIAKRKYKLRYIDRLENISNKIDILNTLIDVLK